MRITFFDFIDEIACVIVQIGLLQQYQKVIYKTGASLSSSFSTLPFFNSFINGGQSTFVTKMSSDYSKKGFVQGFVEKLLQNSYA